MNILVADDDILFLDFLTRALIKDKHSVDVAVDGIEALKKAQDSPYDILLLDILMPLADGISVCNELRSSGCHTPILFLSSIQDMVTRITGLNEGGDDYLIKPFHYDELEARMRAIIRRPHDIAPEQISAASGTLTVDGRKKIIYFTQQPLDLRPKEYAVLDYLVRHAGTVISKDELLKNIWHISTSNASNRLEVCMHHIRTKINVQKKILKTVRGYGYTIDR